MGEVAPRDAGQEPGSRAAQGTKQVGGVKTRDRVVRKKSPPDHNANPVYVACDLAPWSCIGPIGAVLKAGQHRSNGDTNWLGTAI